MRLADKVAIVTGSTRGIGESIARAFYHEGAKVVVSGRDEATGQSIVEDLLSSDKAETSQKRAIFVKADVSKREEVANLKDQTLKSFGAVHVLVNNAGVNAPLPMTEVTLSAWDKIMDIDLKGVLFGSQIIGPEMIKQRQGSVINLASIAARYAFTDGGPYGPAKAAVVMMTKQCAMEWAKYNVRVNAISPGLILTPMSENIYTDQEAKKFREAIVPLGRIGLPEDIANLAVFLASDESSYITAQDILVDGGLTDSVYQNLPGRAVIKEPM